MKPINHQCPTCEGRGYFPGANEYGEQLDEPCLHCKGSGEVLLADAHGESDSDFTDYCRCTAGIERQIADAEAVYEAISAEAVTQIRHDYQHSRVADADRRHALHLTTTAADDVA